MVRSDPEGGGDVDPPVEADGAAAGGEEAVPVRHDAALQQQPGEQEDRAADVCLAGKYSYTIHRITSHLCHRLSAHVI